MDGNAPGSATENDNSNNGNEDPGAGSPGGLDDAGGDVTRYTPEGFPEHLLGDTDQATIDNVFGAYKGLRSETPGTRPDDASGFDFQPNEILAPYFANQSEDPVMNAAKAAAHKLEFTSEQFQSFVDETFTELVKSGQIEPPYDPARELKVLGEYLGTNDPREIEKITTDNETFAKNLAKQLDLPEPAAAFMESLTDLAGGNLILNKIAGAFNERGISIANDTTPTAEITKEELAVLDKDERIDPRSPKFDAELRKKYDEGYRKLHG